MRVLRFSLLSFVCVGSGFVGVFAADKPWKNATEFSLVSANGNSKATTMSGKNTLNYGWSKAALELIGGGMGSKSQGQNTAEKYYASEKVSYKLSDRNYVFEKFGWDKDRFAGIKHRYDSTIGLGREVIKGTKSLLIAELGGGRIVEERYHEKTNSFGSGRAYSKYTYTLSETASFSQDAEVLANFKDKDDYRVNTESALLAALSAHLSLKVSYIWHHVGKPP